MLFALLPGYVGDVMDVNMDNLSAECQKGLIVVATPVVSKVRFKVIETGTSRR